MNVNNEGHPSTTDGSPASTTMSFLQNTTLLPSTSHLKDQQRNGLQALQRKSSLAALIQLVRNPVETVGETVENWRDGSTPEERARKQIIEDKKRLAYVKLRNVRKLERSFLNQSANTDSWRRQPLTMNGKPRQLTSTNSRVTMHGNQRSSRPSMIRFLSRHD